MDRKSRQQYRLKGATKILSEPSIDEPNKNSQQQYEANADSTTSSAMVFGDSVVASPTVVIANTTPMTNSGNSCVVGNEQNLQQQTSSNNTNQILYISTSDAHSSTSSSSNNNYSNLQSNSMTTTMAVMTATQAASQQQPFKSPQILPCDIKSLFECPICFDYAVPPIYQCQNGHLVCQGCSSKITHCPTCRVSISEPSIRNLQLDRLASTFQFPCKYNFNGCQWKSYWFKKRDHEESCDFISYSCPCPGTACKWTGLLSEVMPHLSEHHKSITTLSGEDIVFLATDINLKGAVDWVMIQSCFNHHFLLVLEKQELKTGQQQFFAVVQLIGSQKEAEKFKYKLELGNVVNGQVKRLQWEATPRSILDGIQAAISTYDCLVFDARMAQHFLSPIQKDKDSSQGSSGNSVDNQGENLGINVTIDCLV